MAKVLKEFKLDNGTVLKEVGCGNYICRYCGGKAVGVNLVADMVLQINAKHNGICGAFRDDEKYLGYINDCSTCAYLIDGECTFDGKDKL